MPQDSNIPYDLQPVTDPALLQQLNSPVSVPPDLQPVTDPAILAQLNSSIPRPNQTAIDNTNHDLGVGARAVANGLAGIPLGIADLTTWLANKGAHALNSNTPPVKSYPSQDFNNSLTGMGLPTASTPAGRVTSDLISALYGAGAMQGIGDASTGWVGRALTANPRLQYAGAATGALASSETRENGGTPGQQLAAGIAGGSVPSVASFLGPATIRGLMRGGSQGAQTMADNIAAFDAAGTTPTVGQATQKPLMQALESALSKIPGSAGPMNAKAASQAQEIGDTVQQMASNLSPGANPTLAGMAIKQGITGDNGFIPQFRGTQQDLYNKLGQYIAPDSPISVANTQNTLSNINAPIPGAPMVSQQFQIPRLQAIQNAISQDASGQSPTLPYSAVSKLRTNVGDELANNSIVSDVPQGKWKALYGGLSQDMQQAAADTGPQAQNAWNRANNYTRAGMNRIDLLNGVVNQQTPEAIYQAALSGSSEGATKLNAVMQSLPPEAQQTVSATVLQRLGKATPGNQNDVGDVFSTNTFLTNWNRLSPQAKQTLFGRASYGPQFSQDMDQIASVADNLKSGSKVFSNPSGTSSSEANIGTAGALGSGLIRGSGKIIGGVIGSLTGANIAARAMTNPNFVRWLAQNSQKPLSALPAAANNLAQWAYENKDPDSFAAAQTLLNPQQQQR